VIETSVVDHETVGISVFDNGSGIRPDILDQLFEPFVTTKHQGLGLGLTICRSIATAHGGQLWAANNQDRGSAFRLLLPRNDSLTSGLTASPGLAVPRSVAGTEPQPIGLADELGDRSGLRLLHHAAAVEFHRLLADAEIAAIAC
jgi:hypothetical protein